MKKRGLAVLIGAVAFIAIVAVPNASAHWYGFTGNLYYCAGYYDPGEACWPANIHTFGHVSSWHADATSHNGEYNGPIPCAKAYGAISGKTYFGGCAYWHARYCWNGYYPNCHDHDRYRLKVYFRAKQGNRYEHYYRSHAAY